LLENLLIHPIDPDFYEDGNQFYVWANQYASPINESRVVQTAKAFVQGYLAEFADAYGTIVSVNSTGSVNAIGNSLGPSDACPAFASGADGSSFSNDTDCTPPPSLSTYVMSHTDYNGR
jgi:hypothetical protein